jgi:hypothetical protein
VSRPDDGNGPSVGLHCLRAGEHAADVEAAEGPVQVDHGAVRRPELERAVAVVRELLGQLNLFGKGVPVRKTHINRRQRTHCRLQVAARDDDVDVAY